MKIIQIHRYCHMVGGAERYFFEVSKLLKDNGHDIAFFSMQDKINDNSQWNKYFVSSVSFGDKSIYSRLRLVERILYAGEVRRKIKELLKTFHPDVVHIHDLNIFITPFILQEIKKYKIPIIITIHDYQMLNLACGSLFHGGKICEVTKKRNFYKAIFHRCIPDSFLFCSLFVIAQYIYHFSRLYDCVDYFIAPSRFMRDKLIEYGFDSKKIVHLPYFIDTSEYKEKASNRNNYILYFGRLVPEKGIHNLIEAMKYRPHIKLIIAGGADKYNETYEKRLKLQSRKMKNIQFAGFQGGNKLKRLIAESRFAVLPSLWYENLPNSILESFAYGKPVIASNIGGISELVKDGYNGLLFEPGSVTDLVEKIQTLWNDKKFCDELAKNARNYVVKNFSPKEHYKRFMEIYKMAIERNKS